MTDETGPAVEAPDTDELLSAPPVTAPAEALETVVVPEAEEPSPEPTAEAVSGEIPPEPAIPAPVVERPWVPRADGTDLTIPGAVVLPNGDVRIPAATAAQMHRYLANREAIREQVTASRREIDRLKVQADPKNNEAVIRADALTALVSRLARAGENPETGVPFLTEWLADFDREMPRLQAESRATAAERRAEAAEGRLAPIDQDADARRLEPSDRAALDRTIEAELAGAEYEGLDRESLKAALWEMRDELFRQPTADEAVQYGLNPGQRIIDPRLWGREVKRYQFFAKQLKDAQSRAAKTAVAQQILKPVLAPPAVSAKGSPTPQAQRKPNEPQTAAEWDDDFMKTPLL